MTKYVYLFQEGNKDMKDLLGGKGANLAEMTNLGLPVPKGFTITTEACNRYYEDGKQIHLEIENEIFKNIQELENLTGKNFGNPENPLLVSVRSGARASMPGMMDSIHFLGMNDQVAEGYAIKTGNPRFVYDTYRRFIQTYSDIAEHFEDIKFERLFEELKEELHVLNDTDLTVEQLKYIISRYKEEYVKRKGSEFPTDPKVQLLSAVKGVFESWNGDRAIAYRRLNHIPDTWGTAVNVQENVFGNMNDQSGTGVAFSRNPATGENQIFGEYLVNAQGDDVVAGLRTPKTIDHLKEEMPNVYHEFTQIVQKLEHHYRDMQDMEFTIENGKLYMLQTRIAKRTATAALKVALDLIQEGMITEEEAILRIRPDDLDQLLHTTFDEEALKQGNVIAEGLAASPGAATGKIYFTAKEVEEATKRGEDTILVRLETSPEDITGMIYAKGVLTVRGGMTSHAAVVARGMGRCCVCGCGSLVVEEDAKTLTTADGTVYHEGDFISLDGTTGKVYGEQIATVDPKISGDFKTFMDLVDQHRLLKIKVNADTARDAAQALAFGAEGIGLCRTEHMFFNENRIFEMRKMIAAETKEQRELALMNLLKMQREDFIQLFRVMDGYTVTIRYLDPPLHEFLPHTDEEIAPLANALHMSFEALKERIESLKEFNPMMGHRGCRLDVTYPEIAVMQTRAVIEAAIIAKQEGRVVKPQIMIPLITSLKELEYVKSIVVTTAKKVLEVNHTELDYMVGTMIETPRACIKADELAHEAEFFSFGTNDLTQLTFGFSRDDASKFLKDYYEKQILDFDPFAQIDEKGVGILIEQAISLSKNVRPDIELGICGEHAGEANSIAYCHKIGLDYVSCSPYRVPIARLAAAQASIKEGMNK